jgi:RimJ/RimL family protein N-acetyltransferase
MTIAISQAELILRLKNTAPPLDIPVLDASGTVIGSLVLITAAIVEMPGMVEDLCRWRTTHKSRFLTVFEPSIESMRNYLLNFSLPDPARVLFLLKDAAGRRVGHMGLCNISEQGAELDNVMRGERVSTAKFMQHALKSFIRWSVENLRLNKLYLNVLADNDAAKTTYEQIGFAVVSQQWLERIDQIGGYKLVPSGNEHDQILLHMEAMPTLLRSVE